MMDYKQMIDKSKNYNQEYFEPLDNKDIGVTEIKIDTHVSSDKFKESKRSLENTYYNVRNKKFSTTNKIQNSKGKYEYLIRKSAETIQRRGVYTIFCVWGAHWTLEPREVRLKF